MKKNHLIENLVDALYNYHAGNGLSSETLTSILGIEETHPRFNDMRSLIGQCDVAITEEWKKSDAEDCADRIVERFASRIVDMI